MSDKKLNSVSSVTDAAYVYAETSNGETVKISKADLASVVAGLMPYKGLIYTNSGYKSINTTGGYSFQIKARTAIAVIYDDYYGTFNSFLITEKGSVKQIVSSNDPRLELVYEGDASFLVKSTSGNYGCYISILNLGM